MSGCHDDGMLRMELYYHLVGREAQHLLQMYSTVAEEQL